jgi:hypothetical protein
VAESSGDGLQYKHSLLSYFGTDSVPGKNSDIQLHGCFLLLMK